MDKPTEDKRTPDDSIQDKPAALEQLSRVQQWDRLIEQALYDVEIPDGLQSRLLARFRVGTAHGSVESTVPKRQPQSPEPQSPEPQSPEPQSPVPSIQVRNHPSSLPVLQPLKRASQRRTMGRRTVIVTLSALSALAATAVFAILYWPGQGQVNEICRAAVQTVQRLRSAEWHDMSQAPLVGYPPAINHPGLRPARWQSGPTGLDANTVVYDYGRIGSGAGGLFLCVSRNLRVQGLPQSVPESGVYVAGWHAYAWRRSQWVYVIATDLPPDEIQRLIGQRPALVGIVWRSESLGS